MTKQERDARYYTAHRDAVLEKNRERKRTHRQKLLDEGSSDYIQRRIKANKKVIEESPPPAEVKAVIEVLATLITARQLKKVLDKLKNGVATNVPQTQTAIPSE
jgi:uncharacterized protein (DUF2267 family)